MIVMFLFFFSQHLYSIQSSKDITLLFLVLKEIFLRKREKRKGSVGNIALEKPLGGSGECGLQALQSPFSDDSLIQFTSVLGSSIESL